MIDDRAYIWDRTQNKSLQTVSAMGLPQTSSAHAYDSANRLIRTSGGSGEIAYELDGAQNRRMVTGGSNPGSYLFDESYFELNRYRSSPVYGLMVYDLEGNLIRTGPDGPEQHQLKYDYRNRLVGYTDEANEIYVSFRYDALGRRVEKVVGTNITRFVWKGSQELVEQDEAGTTLAAYIHGSEPDEVVLMRRGTNDCYVHGDDLHSIVAVTDTTGAVLESYSYGDYGELQVLDPAGNPRAESAINNSLAFQGRPLDKETGLYYHRSRYLDSAIGRFTTQDPQGTWDDQANLGNAYAFRGNNPKSPPVGYVGRVGALRFTRSTEVDPPGNGVFYQNENRVALRGKRIWGFDSVSVMCARVVREAEELIREYGRDNTSGARRREILGELRELGRFWDSFCKRVFGDISDYIQLLLPPDQGSSPLPNSGYQLPPSSGVVANGFRPAAAAQASVVHSGLIRAAGVRTLGIKRP